MSPKNQVVAEGKVVGIYYTLRDEHDNVLDTNRKGGPPMAFLHGAGNVLPGLEKALLGKGRNDNVKVTLSAVEGYGERREDGVREMPRSVFASDQKVEPGMMVSHKDDQGRKHSAQIVSVAEDTITIDSNHPLAGKALYFDVSITGIRDATAEERTHGHPHGPGGHRH